ncbi:MAG: hypothetical protein M3Q65_20350, partial [Chloroflexota bacterium]|nr:hypothetical protein [Chloroflexota bacterium]
RLTGAGRAQAEAAEREGRRRRNELARRLAVAEDDIHLEPAALARALPAEALRELEVRTGTAGREER